MLQGFFLDQKKGAETFYKGFYFWKKWSKVVIFEGELFFLETALFRP
jgi:hypothetical protein